MKRLVGLSVAAILLVGWSLKGEDVEKKQPESNIDSQAFGNAFGSDSKAGQPHYILRLPSGYMIGCENWQYDKKIGTVTFHKCRVVMRNQDSQGPCPSVAICSKSGVASVNIIGRRGFFTEMAESIQSIQFHDGSTFHFPVHKVQSTK